MRHYLLRRISALLSLSVLFSSCNGQERKKGADEQKVVSKRYPKIVLTKDLGKVEKQYEVLCAGVQDRAGNMWFCTTGEGVYRYDGKLFTHFTVKDGLYSSSVFSILEDKDGDIWFGTKEALCRYDGKTFTNIPIPQPGLTDLLFDNAKSTNSNTSSRNELWSMMQDRSGKFWLGTTYGIYCYDGRKFLFFLDDNNIANKDSVKLKWTQCIFEDKNGNIWFGSWVLANEGMCRYDGRSITQYKPFGDGWIRGISEDKNGDLLIVTRHRGLCRFDGTTFTNITAKGGIVDESINVILEDKAGNIWIGTELGSGQIGENGGVWRYDGKTFKKFTTKDGLIHNGVYSIVEDKAGYIWLGTRNTGLSRYDGKTFTSFSE